jgi:signal transduction histidine kinase
MKGRSLFIRLGVAAAIMIVIGLTLAAFGLRAIFNTEIERRATSELTQIVRTLAAQVRIDADGMPVLDVNLPDPRFETPYSGLYWQVSRADGRSARSRSLWDDDLRTKENAPIGERQSVDLTGPNGTRLLGVAQTILVSPPGGDDVSLRVVAALDRQDIAAAQRSFLRLLVFSLAALGLILIVAMAFFIRLALRPFGVLARELQAIHGGQSRALSGDFPEEVQGVVDDLNRLVAFQDAALERAKTQAGDLAHGLKTPLTVLEAIARQAVEEGRKDLAEAIKEQVKQMRRQIDRVLARARAGIAPALGRKRTDVAPVASKIMRAFERLPRPRPLVWEFETSPDAVFPGEEGDLVEILGNLLDNAGKWARSKVHLTVTMEAGILLLHVDDDGPGLPHGHALQIARGRRWDEEQPGSGFGLAITRDLVEGYRGTLEFGQSELGGLRVAVSVPLVVHRP